MRDFFKRTAGQGSLEGEQRLKLSCKEESSEGQNKGI